MWIVGGDGWAYDIGFGGLDHVPRLGPQREDLGARHRGVLEHRRPGVQGDAAGRRREVRRRGQAHAKKDLGLIASSYGNVYVAQVAMGADNAQTVKAFAEAEAHTGPSLIIAYSTCIAHGIEMATSHDRTRRMQSTAVTGRCTGSTRGGRAKASTPSRSTRGRQPCRCATLRPKRDGIPCWLARNPSSRAA